MTVSVVKVSVARGAVSIGTIAIDTVAARRVVFASSAVRLSVDSRRVELAVLYERVSTSSSHAFHGNSQVGLEALSGLVNTWHETELFLSGIVDGTEQADTEGDLGGTYSFETRTPFQVASSSSVGRGKRALTRMFSDTASPGQVHDDEFELIDHGEGRFTAVLPGVVDLSRPHIGHQSNRTARDLDQYALRSATSAQTADNKYAEMVASYLSANIPEGSKLTLVGHSFGADTAADLAADSTFNGVDGRFDVTHVVVAGYESEPQMASIPSSTQVLVLQNDVDLAVAVGRAGYHPDRAVHALGDGFGRLANGNAAGANDEFHLAVDELSATADSSKELAWDVAVAPFRAVRSGEVRDDVARGDLSQTVVDMLDLSTFDAGVRKVADNQTLAVFSGGVAGIGHQQTNYTDYVNETADPEVTSFLASLADDGYAEAGVSKAVDISVPSPSPSDPSNFFCHRA